MKANVIWILILSALLLGLSGCTYAVRYDSSLRGKVIDSETKEPIQGAVALGIWYTTIDWLSHAPSDFYDAYEVETDENGEFMIPGKGPRVMSNIQPMEPFVYKSGYTERSLSGWENKFKGKDFYGMGRITWDGNKFIVPMKKLTMEERKKRKGLHYNAWVYKAPYEKVKLYIREINKECEVLEIEPLKPWGENE